MARFWTRADVDALAENATIIEECASHENYDGSSRKNSRETAPYQKGDIVKAQLCYPQDEPKDFLIYRVEPRWSDRSFEYIDDYCGFVRKKDGSFGTMLRHISRGDITRGYQEPL